MHVQNLMNSLWDICIFLGLVPKESPCIYTMLLQISFQKCCRSHYAAMPAVVIVEFEMVMVLVLHPFLLCCLHVLSLPRNISISWGFDQNCNLEWSMLGEIVSSYCYLRAKRSLQYIYLLNVQYRLWIYAIMTFVMNMNLCCQCFYYHFHGTKI